MSKEFVDEAVRDASKRDQTECAERALDKANEGIDKQDTTCDVSENAVIARLRDKDALVTKIRAPHVGDEIARDILRDAENALINRRINRDGKKETVQEARARVRKVMDSWKAPAPETLMEVPTSGIDWSRLKAKIASEHTPKPEYTGSSVSYYTVQVDNPTTATEPYSAECNDIIESLHMNFAEGNIFKAIWRRCAARKGLSKKGYTDGQYDAEKIVFFGERLVAMEKTK